MATVDELLERIRNNGHDIWIAGPQSETTIAELERVMSVRLPPSYRGFVARFGTMSIYDSTISGIFDGEAISESVTSLYGATVRTRQIWQLPQYLLVVQSNDDAPYCLDTRCVDTTGEMPVLCYELHSGSDSQIAKSFDQFLIPWFLENWAEEDSGED